MAESHAPQAGASSPLQVFEDLGHDRAHDEDGEEEQGGEDDEIHVRSLPKIEPRAKSREPEAKEEARARTQAVGPRLSALGS